MRVRFCLLLLLPLFGMLHALRRAYTTVAETIAEPKRLCWSDCINGTCPVDIFYGHPELGNPEEECAVLSKNNVASKFRTAQVHHKHVSYCVSNCGTFGMNYERCYVGEGHEWDYCNSSDDDRVSVYGRKCKDRCAKYEKDYYWCTTDCGTEQYCAPPRETQCEDLIEKVINDNENENDNDHDNYNDPHMMI